MMSKFRRCGSRAPTQWTPGASSTAPLVSAAAGMLGFLFLVGMAAATAVTFRAMHAGLDVAFRQVDILQAQPGIDQRHIETDHALLAYFHQWPADEQRVAKQEMQGILEAQVFRDDLAGLDVRRRTVEPLGDRQLAEEGKQAIRRPGLGLQAIGLDSMTSGGEQGLLAQISLAARLFVKGDDGHQAASRQRPNSLSFSIGMPVSEPGGFRNS